MPVAIQSAVGGRKAVSAAPKEHRRGVKLDIEDLENLREVKRVVCTCGLCRCSNYHQKHHCPVHHGTNTLMLDPTLKHQYNPKSDYQSTFHAREYQPVIRRGLAPPARILPEPPQSGMDLLTVTHRDFVPKPVQMNELCKAKNNLRTPRGAFQDDTSYKIDFPLRDLDKPAPFFPIKPTLPQLLEVQPFGVYQTTNKCYLRDWEGAGKSTPYRELQEDRFFKGDVQKESVSKVDFSDGAVEGGRPSTSCKVAPILQKPEGEFVDKTIHKTIYKLPVITEREPNRLKGKSEKHKETLDPIIGKMNAKTQYQRDNPGFFFHTSKRWMCPPYPDKLQLFEGAFRDQSVHKSSYRTMPERPTPVINYKANALATYPQEGGQFYGNTTNKTFYQRVPSKERFAEAQAVNDVASKVSFLNKDGRMMKETQHFGGEFHNQTTNQTEYFNFSKLPLRERHGDHSERVFKPSQAKFNAQSVTKTAFVPVRAERVEQFKPLDDRFHSEGAKYCSGFSNESVYKIEFPPKPLPKLDRCPADLILQEA